MKNKISLFTVLAFMGLSTFSGCASDFLKPKKDSGKDIYQNTEFEKKVLIKEVPATEAPVAPSTAGAAAGPATGQLKPVAGSMAVPLAIPKLDVKKPGIPKSKIKRGKTESLVVASETKLRQPEIEDREGFNNERRPLVDPFKIGEKVTHSVSYFGTTAGILTFSVAPYVEVNGRRSYNFKTEIKSSRLFSSFYAVQDEVETYMDYVDLLPHVFKLHIKESGQLKEAQSFFDHTGLKANYWEHKYTEKNGHEEKKLNWDISPYSQNAFSSVFYMRIFKWTVGKEITFPVSDDEKNVVFKGKALEKVELQTDAGKFKAIKIKAEIVSRGALTQTGDLIVWISDDDRKYILRIEAKIKIGTLVSEITSLNPG